MIDLNDLLYFARVVDHGGFAAAGRAIGVPKSKLSRRIQRLEDQLGVRLLNRSSRRFSVTELGREFYDHCAAMLREAEAAEQVVAEVRAEPRGIVRIACPVALLDFQFGDLIAEFMAIYPAVEVYVEATNRRVDVIAEAFDLAIRVRFPPMEPSDLMMRQFDVSTQCLVASPAIAATSLASPADLAGLPSLDLGPPRRDHHWRFAAADGRTATVPHRPRLVTDDMSALRKAALRGLGAVQLPTLMVWQDVAAGRLVHLLPGWEPPAGIVHAVFASRRGLLPAVRALIDFLSDACVRQRAAAASVIAPPN